MAVARKLLPPPDEFTVRVSGVERLPSGRRAVHRQVVDPGRHRRRDAYCEGRAGPGGARRLERPGDPGGRVAQTQRHGAGKSGAGDRDGLEAGPPLDHSERPGRERQRVVRGRPGAAFFAATRRGAQRHTTRDQRPALLPYDGHGPSPSCDSSPGRPHGLWFYGHRDTRLVSVRRVVTETRTSPVVLSGKRNKPAMWAPQF